MKRKIGNLVWMFPWTSYPLEAASKSWNQRSDANEAQLFTVAAIFIGANTNNKKKPLQKLRVGPFVRINWDH